MQVIVNDNRQGRSCLTVVFILAIIGDGLLPFPLVFLLTDVNGLTDIDNMPIYALVSKFIGSRSRIMSEGGRSVPV
jgi:hypothetical protein